jgi:hypothetical protein
MLRYNVGQVVLFVLVDFEQTVPRFGCSYYPWEDTLKGIELLKLTCQEHHRVSGSWDDEKKYDGFIFTDGVNNYNNQYPRASYGQLDTSNDYRVRHNHKVYTDVCVYLDALKDGVYDLREKKPEWAEKLKHHMNEIVLLINKEGYDVKEEPIVFNKVDGLDSCQESFPDITMYKLHKQE